MPSLQREGVYRKMKNVKPDNNVKDAIELLWPVIAFFSLLWEVITEIYAVLCDLVVRIRKCLAG